MEGKLIKDLSSDKNRNYQELIDLSEYAGKKVILKLDFKRASGKIDFFLE